MRVEAAGNPTPADVALTQLAEGLDRLLKAVEGGGLEGFDDAELIGFMQGFEQLRNRLPLIDHAVITDANRRDLPGALCQGSMRRVLASALRLSPGEVAARVRAAEAVGPRASMLGERMEPRRPVLASAQRDGTVTSEQVDIITRALGGVDRRRFDPADIAAGEWLLTGFAATFGTKDLQAAGGSDGGRDRPRRHPTKVRAEPGAAVLPAPAHPRRRLHGRVPAHRRPRRETDRPAWPARETPY